MTRDPPTRPHYARAKTTMKRIINCHFQHIWCMGPCLRTWKINCAFFRNCCTVCMVATCGPCAETCGLYFSKVKVRYQRLPDGDEDKDIMIAWGAKFNSLESHVPFPSNFCVNSPILYKKLRLLLWLLILHVCMNTYNNIGITTIVNKILLISRVLQLYCFSRGLIKLYFGTFF
jgi:hypothetical protein